MRCEVCSFKLYVRTHQARVYNINRNLTKINASLRHPIGIRGFEKKQYFMTQGGHQ